MNVTLGEIVNSKAGRDIKKPFVVISIIDEAHVLVSDGDLRKVDKPKKKKLKHLIPTGVVIEYLNEKLVNNTKVSNSEIRKMLKAYLNENQVSPAKMESSDKI